MEVNEGITHLTPQQELIQGSTYLEPADDDANESNMNLRGEQTNMSTTQTAETVMLPTAHSQLMTEDVRETAGGGLPSMDNVLPRPVDLEQEKITDIHTDLSEYITPNARKRALISQDVRQHDMPQLGEASKFFPQLFANDIVVNDNTRTVNTKTPSLPSWGDYNGTEHPYSNIPVGWTRVNEPSTVSKLTSKAKKLTPKVSPPAEDIAYAQFMSNILEGIDEQTQQRIYARAKNLTHLKISSDVNTETTVSHTQRRTAQDHATVNDSTFANEGNHDVPQTDLLPDIIALRKTTPGGDPKLPQVPKTAHQPIDQVLPHSYLAHNIRTPNVGDPDDSDPSSSSTEGNNSTGSGKARQKLHKHREYRRCEKIRIAEATKIKIDTPQPYDGSSDFNAFERWTYAVNAWFEITEFPNRHRVRHMLAFMRGCAQQFYMMFIVS